MDAVMTQAWKDKYFDEKFKNLTENINTVREEVRANTRLTEQVKEQSDNASKRVDELEVDVALLKGTPDKKDLMKNIGIVIGTAGGIITAAVLTFRSLMS